MAIERTAAVEPISRRGFNKRFAGLVAVTTLFAPLVIDCARQSTWHSTPDVPFPPNEFIDNRYLENPRNLDILLALVKNFPEINYQFAASDIGQIAPDSQDAAKQLRQALDQHNLKHLLFARAPKYRLAIGLELAEQAQFGHSYRQFNAPMPIFMLEASQNTALAHQPLNYWIVDQKIESLDEGTVTKVEKRTSLNVLFAARFADYLQKDLALLINYNLLPNQPPSAFLFPFKFRLIT